jgi:NitT/TauT family transport system substrate-binding protein
MNPRNLFLRAQRSPLCWFYFAVSVLQLLLIGAEVQGQTRLAPVRTAYSALSAGIGTLWLTQEDGYFRKHGLDSSLIYIRGGTTAVQALLAGEIQFGHLSPAPMMTAWAQGADFVWVGTTTHQMVFTLLVDNSIAKAADLRGKKIGITRLGSASELAVRMALEQFALNPKDVTMIALGGIPEILGAMRAGAVQCGVLSPPTSTAARDMGYRPHSGAFNAVTSRVFCRSPQNFESNWPNRYIQVRERS